MITSEQWLRLTKELSTPFAHSWEHGVFFTVMLMAAGAIIISFFGATYRRNYGTSREEFWLAGIIAALCFIGTIATS